VGYITTNKQFLTLKNEKKNQNQPQKELQWGVTRAAALP